MFGGLLVTRFYLLGGTRPDLDQFLGLIVTSVLLISSFFMNRAEVQISQGDRKGFVTSTIITMVLGIGFPGGRGRCGVADCALWPRRWRRKGRSST